MQLQSNDKIKALEVELKEVKEDSEHNTTSMNVDSDNKTGSFYTDLREDKKNRLYWKNYLNFKIFLKFNKNYLHQTKFEVSCKYTKNIE